MSGPLNIIFASYGNDSGIERVDHQAGAVK